MWNGRRPLWCQTATGRLQRLGCAGSRDSETIHLAVSRPIREYGRLDSERVVGYSEVSVNWSPADRWREIANSQVIRGSATQAPRRVLALTWEYATLPYHAPLCRASYPVEGQFGKRCSVRQRDWCLLACPPAVARNGSLFDNRKPLTSVPESGNRNPRGDQKPRAKSHGEKWIRISRVKSIA